MVFIMQKGQINVNEHGYKPSRKLIDHISDRLRVKGQLAKATSAYVYWKQLPYCRTKVRNFLRLGTKLKTAIYVAISRKGHWRLLARTLTTRFGEVNF